MKKVSTRDAVGMMLCHDVTQIVPGTFKGPRFKKGHIIGQDDVARLLDLGKAHVYVLNLDDGYLHEDDAAIRIATAACGKGLELTAPSEGKVSFKALDHGLLKVNVAALNQINAIEEIIFATLHTNRRVDAKTTVAGTRIIPLATRKAKIDQVTEICRRNYPLIELKPIRACNVGIITTGSEVYHDRIEDKFGPVLHVKFAELASRVLRQVFVPDNVAMTVAAIHDLIADGAELIAITGGMSVDPDDLTPASIRAAGGKVITYGAPVLPGAMFMLAYIDDIPVVGLPGCVMYHQTSIFDLIVPRILAGERPTRSEITALGHGGLCLDCPNCTYPNCAFGKG